jgi:serine/threonine protein kinase
VVLVLDDDETPDGTVYLVMELLEGETLQTVASEGRKLPTQSVLCIARDVLEVLEVAHAKDIVHPDLKPANLLVARRAPPRERPTEPTRIVASGAQGEMAQAGAVLPERLPAATDAGLTVPAEAETVPAANESSLGPARPAPLVPVRGRHERSRAGPASLRSPPTSEQSAPPSSASVDIFESRR